MRFSVVFLFLCLASSGYANPSDPTNEVPHIPVDNHIPGHHRDGANPSAGIKPSSLIASAMELLGTPYREGGDSMDTGFDCSGFVRSIYSQTIGLMLPRSAEQQAAATKKIERNELRPGDLVFFNTMRRAFSHVGIYIGEGKFIHSTKSGGAVRVDDMAMQYWQQRYNGARRVRGPYLGSRRLTAADVQAHLP